MSLTGKIMDFFADKAMTIPAFPRTKVKAVSDDDGVGLNVLLDELRNEVEAKAASSHEHSANDITDGVIPVERGGTGAATRAEALQSWFPNNATPTYLPVFGSGWNSRGFTTPANLQSAMGLSGFKAYEWYYGAGTEIDALSTNWSSIDVGTFLLFLNLHGTYYGFVGMKLNESYGALIQLSYGTGAIYKYRLNAGTWYEHAHNV